MSLFKEYSEDLTSWQQFAANTVTLIAQWVVQLSSNLTVGFLISISLKPLCTVRQLVNNNFLKGINHL